MEWIVWAVAFGISCVANAVALTALFQCDRQRVKALEELARLKARRRIHQFGPNDAAEEFREACR